MATIEKATRRTLKPTTKGGTLKSTTPADPVEDHECCVCLKTMRLSIADMSKHTNMCLEKASGVREVDLDATADSDASSAKGQSDASEEFAANFSKTLKKATAKTSLHRKPKGSGNGSNKENQAADDANANDSVGRGPLGGVVACVEVRTVDTSALKAVCARLEQLGARTVAKVTGDCTHLIFKDGRKSVWDAAVARQPPVAIVSVVWVEECHKEQTRLPEADYQPETESRGHAKRRVKSMEPDTADAMLSRSKKRPISISPKETAPVVVLCPETQLPYSPPGAPADPAMSYGDTQTDVTTLAGMCLLKSTVVEERSARSAVVGGGKKAFVPDSPVREADISTDNATALGGLMSPAGGDEVSVTPVKTGDTRARVVSSSRTYGRRSAVGAVSPRADRSAGKVWDEIVNSARKLTPASSGNTNESSGSPKEPTKIHKGASVAMPTALSPKSSSAPTVTDGEQSTVASKECEPNEVPNAAAKERAPKRKLLPATDSSLFEGEGEEESMPAKRRAVLPKKKSGVATTEAVVAPPTNISTRDIFAEDPTTERKTGAIATTETVVNVAEPHAIETKTDSGVTAKKEAASKPMPRRTKKGKVASSTNEGEGEDTHPAGKGNDGQTEMLTLTVDARAPAPVDVLDRPVTAADKATPTVTPSSKRKLDTEAKAKAGAAGKKHLSKKRRTEVEELPPVVITNVNSKLRDQLETAIAFLGRTATEHSDAFPDDTTHVICGDKRRTLAVLHAMARGCWMLSPSWALKSMEAGKWLDEEPYEIGEIFPATSVARLERVVAHINGGGHCDGAVNGGFLAACGPVFIGGGTRIDRKELKRLVLACGGSVSEIFKRSYVCIGTPPTDVKSDVRVATENWLLDSIMEHKMLPLSNYAH